MTEKTNAISKNPDLMQALVNDLMPSLDEAMDAYEASGSTEDFMVWNDRFVSDYADRKIAARLATPEKSAPATMPGKAAPAPKAKKAAKAAKAPAKATTTPSKAAKAPKSGKVETSLTPAEKDKRLSDLTAVTESVRKETSNIASSYMRIGYQLWMVRERKLYLASDLKNVYEYSELAFGFKKSSTKNFVAVCERFSIKDKFGMCSDKIDPAFALFGYSQLSLMLPLSPKTLLEVKPEMTANEIRSLKSGQTFGQNDSDTDSDSDKPSELVKPKVCYTGMCDDSQYDHIMDVLMQKCKGHKIQITWF